MTKYGRHTKLDEETADIIVEWIGKGAYDWVAAQAAGITPNTFRNWMQREPKGEGFEEEDDMFTAFQNRVRKARAQVRAQAEAAVFKDAPFNWLRFGPGRERPGEPGWTDSTAITGGDGSDLQIRVVYESEEPVGTDQPQAT